MERALGALRDFTRRDILLRFYADRKPRSVDDVARESGVHRSVAFEHLERLVSLGYLEVAHRRGLPGKPAKIYKLTGGPVQISPPLRPQVGGRRAPRAYETASRSLGEASPSPRNSAHSDQIEPLNPAIPRVLIKRCAISAG